MWQSLFKAVPADGQVVWIRVLSIYGELTLATTSYEPQGFYVVQTGVFIPAYMVARWKAQ